MCSKYRPEYFNGCIMFFSRLDILHAKFKIENLLIPVYEPDERYSRQNVRIINRFEIFASLLRFELFKTSLINLKSMIFFSEIYSWEPVSYSCDRFFFSMSDTADCHFNLFH